MTLEEAEFLCETIENASQIIVATHGVEIIMGGELREYIEDAVKLKLWQLRGKPQ